MWRESCSKGHGLESRHHILDGHFSHIFVVKICNVCLKRPKINEKEAGVGPFFKNICLWLKHAASLFWFYAMPSSGQLICMLVHFAGATKSLPAESLNLNLLILDGPSPAPFSFISILSNRHYNFTQQINVKKCPSSMRIQTHDLGNMSRPP